MWRAEGLKVLFSIKVHWKVGTGLWQNPLAKADFAIRFGAAKEFCSEEELAEALNKKLLGKLQQSFQAQFSL